MAEIQRLDKNTASKIAAGEVVDRPLNVVKELVENALDAGAGRITVKLEGGGSTLISVADNGKGIPYNELSLAVERFATSKVRSVEDVYNINTFGFRGEALAAISSVSKFTLKSVRQEDQPGEVYVNYGETIEVRPSAISRGSQVTVEGLFNNLPVRKKFLKSQRANDGEILRFLKHFSMINAGVEIIAVFDGKEVYRTYPSNTTLDLAKRVLDTDQVMQGEHAGENIQVKVCTTHPSIQRKRRDSIYIGVNGRVVKEPSLVQAVVQAYHRLIPANTYPAALVDIRIMPSLVDVNIHPSKSEVRFDSSSEIFTHVHKATEAALKKFAATIYAEVEEELNSDLIEDPKTKISRAALEQIRQQDPFINPLTPTPAVPVSEVREKQEDYKPVPGFDLSREMKTVPAYDCPTDSLEIKPAPEAATSQDEEPGVGEISLKAVGQIDNTYIVCSNSQGDLVVIDQHVAHERVLYEKYLNDRMQAVPSITLFEPVVVKLNAEEIDFLLTIQEDFNRFGYAYESFGPHEIKIIRVPLDTLKKDIGKEFTGIMQDAMDLKKSRTQDYAIVTMSCKNAVKAGDPLNLHEMQHLVDTLMTTRNPHTCPHGRPILFRMSASELAKKFQRQ